MECSSRWLALLVATAVPLWMTGPSSLAAQEVMPLCVKANFYASASVLYDTRCTSSRHGGFEDAPEEGRGGCHTVVRLEVEEERHSEGYVGCEEQRPDAPRRQRLQGRALVARGRGRVRRCGGVAVVIGPAGIERRGRSREGRGPAPVVPALRVGCAAGWLVPAPVLLALHHDGYRSSERSIGETSIHRPFRGDA